MNGKTKKCLEDVIFLPTKDGFVKVGLANIVYVYPSHPLLLRGVRTERQAAHGYKTNGGGAANDRVHLVRAMPPLHHSKHTPY